MVNLGEVSTLDNIFCWGITPQWVPFTSVCLPGPPPSNMEPFQLLQRNGGGGGGGEGDSLLMAENKLAAGLPRQHSNNKAEKAL